MAKSQKSSIPSKCDIAEITTTNITSILENRKNGDKGCKQKKRIRFMVDKDNENDGDDVVVDDEEPLRKKRRMNKKLSVRDRIHGIYEENRVLIKTNKTLNDKCNEYEREKKQLLEKIKELETSNNKHRDIMTKMISIIGREDDKNMDMNGNKYDNPQEVVVIDGNHHDKEYGDLDRNKNREKEIRNDNVNHNKNDESDVIEDNGDDKNIEDMKRGLLRIGLSTSQVSKFINSDFVDIRDALGCSNDVLIEIGFDLVAKIKAILRKFKAERETI